MHTLVYPRVTNYGGVPAEAGAFPDTGAISWDAAVTLHDADDEDADCLTVGTLTFLTARLCGDLPELLDAISGDTAEFAPLFDGDFVVERLQEQFESACPAGILLLDQTHLHPAVRGHDLGAWAVAEIVNTMTFGRDVLVLTHPSPPGGQDLPKRELRQAQNRLARYWEKVGLVRLDTAPHLMGQSTVYTCLDAARVRLAPVAEVRIEVDAATVEELRRESPPRSTAQRRLGYWPGTGGLRGA
ncbi:hypothetical protein [Candidatus Mycolicibacterium alkanivorans]|uniref:Uncharacterized protein n=1 Tax=Candidatus Mycolicibacterium alkanivorans TaxID=2954114 RepID=A0ABS9YV76_9MYCO|nr:hypothetical protein [Candidatus Mycolicibacterium alkanivorans]MCI4675146.1 hypothetical protein [Candidatus Mycolicibacterium alkanivorans]